MSANLYQLYTAAHAELASAAAKVADPATDNAAYASAYAKAAETSPAWQAFLAADKVADKRAARDLHRQLGRYEEMPAHVRQLMYPLGVAWRALRRH